MAETLLRRTTLYFGGGPEDQRVFSVLTKAGIPVKFIGTLALEGKPPELEIGLRAIRGAKNIRKFARRLKGRL